MTKSTIKLEYLLSQLIDRLAIAGQDIRTHFYELSDEQLGFQPAPGSWSIMECILHLQKTDTAYMEPMQKALAGLKETTSKDTDLIYKAGFTGRLMVNFVRPSNTKKLKAPKSIIASDFQVDRQDLQNFLDHQQQMMDLIRSCDGFNINLAKFRSPLLWILKLSLAEALDLLVNHQERHILQAKRVLAHPEFPTN